MNSFNSQMYIRLHGREKLEPVTRNASDAGIGSDSVCTHDKRFVHSRSLIIHICSTAYNYFRKQTDRFIGEKTNAKLITLFKLLKGLLNLQRPIGSPHCFVLPSRFREDLSDQYL